MQQDVSGVEGSTNRVHWVLLWSTPPRQFEPVSDDDAEEIRQLLEQT